MHDPNKQASYLRQALAHAKRPFGFFLGAGCPVSIKSAGEPLIPDIGGITQFVLTHLAGPDKSSLEILLKELKADGVDRPSVEDLLSTIRSLHQVCGGTTVRGLNKGQLEGLDVSICKAIVDLVNKDLPKGSTPYDSLGYWLGATARSEAVEIFTPNYDLLLEQALERLRVPFFDGFVGSHRPFFDLAAIEQDSVPTRWARVWKVHGSINWELQEEGGVVSRSHPTAATGSRVIHPSHLKYDESRRMPYLALIDRMRAFLRKESSIFIVAGYSFRDDHINEVILQALSANRSLAVFALMYGPLDGYPKAIRLAESRANFSLLATDSAVIARQRAPWREPTAGPAPVPPAVRVAGTGPDARFVFELGDFLVLGRFLDDLVGRPPAEEL